MIDTEMLAAIGSLIDEKLEPMKQEQQSMRQEQQRMRQELKEVHETLVRVALTQENDVLPQLQVLYDNQVKINDEHKLIESIKDNCENLNLQVCALNEVTKEHTKAIKQLQSKAM